MGKRTIGLGGFHQRIKRVPRRIPTAIDHKEVICAFCAKPFRCNSHGYKTQYCSNDCRKNGKRKSLLGLSSGTVGAINELKVCADLLSKGYEVFRAVSPSCSCDLVVLKDEKFLRIEVKTGRLKKNGDIENTNLKHRADILVFVFPERIVYLPPL